MALNCPVDVVYCTSPEQKQRSKNAAYRYKFGSPKIRDLLREKCRARVRDARVANYDAFRNTDTEKNLFKQILREELAQLEEDLKMQDLIYEEMAQEINDWLVDYEEQENYLMELLSDEVVFCPLCQKRGLKQGITDINCGCGESFRYNGNLRELRDRIENVLSMHLNNCDHQPVFFTEPQENDTKKLCLLCEECDYFYNF